MRFAEQENKEDGVRFLRDMDEKLVHEVAALLGLEPVGWVGDFGRDSRCSPVLNAVSLHHA